MDKSSKIFQVWDVDTIAEAITELFTEVIDELAPVIKYQIRKNESRDSQKTRDLQRESTAQFKVFKNSQSIDDQRLLRNLKNR